MKPFKDNPNKASVNKDEKLLKPAHFKARRVDKAHNEDKRLIMKLHFMKRRQRETPRQSKKNPSLHSILLGNAEKT